MGIVVNETKKINRKEEIVKQATILFRQRGYAATSVRDLAHESGIEAPSLYSHFKSKEDILQRICFHSANAFMNGLSKAEKKKKPEDKLRRAIREHVRVVTRNLDASAVMWNEWKHLTKPDLDDFKGLKFRMPGIGGEVLRALGVTVVNLPVAEIYPALASGAIDAAEWVGPWHDLAFGFNKITKHLYFPG